MQREIPKVVLLLKGSRPRSDEEWQVLERQRIVVDPTGEVDRKLRFRLLRRPDADRLWPLVQEISNASWREEVLDRIV
jgi:hypothetical protein